MSCPQPVVLALKIIKNNEDDFEVLVNSVVSMENVIRCVNKNKLKADVLEDGEDYIIKVTR